MARYAVAQLEDIDEISDGRCPLRPVRLHFGIQSFGIAAWTGHAAGDRIINEHDESDDEQEELYLVHTGHATFELDGASTDAPAGTFVFAAPGVKRTAFAVVADTTVIALGATPGRVYQPSGLELWTELRPLYDAGEFATAAERGRALLAEHDEIAGVLYNVACCESLAGQPDAAIEHIGRAIALDERCRKWAAGDSDFDPLRELPAFAALLGD